MHQLSLQLGGLPLHLVLISNGTIGLVPNNLQTVIFDMPEDGIHATIMPEKMLVGNKEIPYNTALSLESNPELKEWLINQQLERPY